jgi:hypothetical protein
MDFEMTDAANNSPEDSHTTPPTSSDDEDSNFSDTMDVPSTSQIPSSSHDSVNSGSGMPYISFLCNPNDEEESLRQPTVSQLFDKNLSSVQKRSWAKDSTCEQVHLFIALSDLHFS